jgi:membrane-bound lytic murein transglycosylase D
MKPKIKRILAGLAVSALLAAVSPGRALERAPDAAFPAPPELESNVRFWTDVFTRYSRDQVILHDMDSPGRIYALVDVAELSPDIESQRKKREKRVTGERDRISGLLQGLAGREAGDTLRTDDERRLLALFDVPPTPEVLRRAADRIRSQSGLRESFLEGLVRSGRTIGEIRRIFREEGLPEELVYLPHVESSFNNKAVSKAGAAGVWQFTRSTGRLFLTVDDDIDERFDPLISAEAAARLLKHNYEATGRWPLAVTAYNHGLLSIRKAMQDLNTDDLMDLIRAYEAKPFGFASKNFYAEFLAAARIAADPDAYFGAVVLDPPDLFKIVELPLPLNLEIVKRVFAADGDTLAFLNPAFRKPVLKGEREIPKGYALRLPVSTDVPAAFEALVSLGVLPRGAWRAWCKETAKDLFRYVDSDEGGGHHGFEPRS